MKKQLLLLAGMLCFVVTAWAAPTAKAIYCAANTTLYFTYDEVTYNTSTAYDNLDGNTPTNIFSIDGNTSYRLDINHSWLLRALSDQYFPDQTAYDIIKKRPDSYWSTSLKTPWANIVSSITTINFLSSCNDWKPTTLDAYFALMYNLTSIIGGNNLNTSEVTSMSNTFNFCLSLTNFDFLSEWNVENVVSMNNTFEFCDGLTDLNALSDWKTISLKNMKGTFQYCRNITNIEGLSNWNVNNVKVLNSTFCGCEGITNIDALSEWNLPILSDIYRTFAGCNHLQDISPIQDWDVSNCASLACTFQACTQLDSEDFEVISDWDISNVMNLSNTFRGCNTTNLDFLSKWNTENVKIMDCTFEDNRNLVDIEALENWITDDVVRMDYIFFGCRTLADFDPISNWNTSNVYTLGYAFGSCKNLTNVDFMSSWDTQRVGILSYIFTNCDNLSNIDGLRDLDWRKLRLIDGVFYKCIGLKGVLDVSFWDLSDFTLVRGEEVYIPTQDNPAYYYQSFQTFYNTFAGCSEITGIIFGKGNVGTESFAQKVCSNTFVDCTKLRFIDFSKCTDTYNNIPIIDRSEPNSFYSGGIKYYSTGDMFNGVPRTCVIYLPSGNGQPTEGDLENVVYTASDETLQCDKYYSEDKVDIELPHRFHADLATYERTFNSNYGGVILPYPVKINDNDEDEFQPFLLQREFKDHMFFKGIAEVPANTPFCFKRKQASTDMTFRMEDLWVESTYDISGETSDNVEEGFAWKTQGFYVNNVIEPENGTFSIPTMDDYAGTETVDYEVDHVYYLSKNRFYRCDDAALTLAPHRILFYGLWEKYSGTDPEMSGSFDFEELGDEVVDAIQAAETDMDEAKAAAIYDANGNRLSKTQHGLNILRMSDGSVKKVIKK